MAREGSAAGVANGDGESRRRNSPWASVVRGENSSATASSPAEDDNFLNESWVARSDSNGGAWNRPPNDPIPAVMGGTGYWPELSLNPTPVSDGSPQQAPIISQSPQRSANSSSSVNGNHGNSTGNNPNSARPRPKTRGGGGGGNSSGTGQSQRTFNQPSLSVPPHVSHGQMHAISDNPGRGSTPIGGVGTSQSHSGNDHYSQRSNSRRNNYGTRPRGDGQYHNYGGRHVQDRRDVYHLPHFVPLPHSGCMPPPMPTVASTHMAPPPMRGFPGQFGFDMAPRLPPNFYGPQMPPEPFWAVPIVHPPMHNPLTNMIIEQIDYYFSDDNLAQDYFLKSNMDASGWVPISLIASFRLVQLLTKDIPLILESLRYSMVVEVQGDKVRRRNEWNKWILSPNISGSGTSSSANVLASSLQEVSLDDASFHTNGNVDAREGQPEMAAG